MNILRFVIRGVLTRDFWLLFIATYAIFLLMAWRAMLRDQVFRSAARMVGKYL